MQVPRLLTTLAHLEDLHLWKLQVKLFCHDYHSCTCFSKSSLQHSVYMRRPVYTTIVPVYVVHIVCHYVQMASCPNMSS